MWLSLITSRYSGDRMHESCVRSQLARSRALLPLSILTYYYRSNNPACGEYQSRDPIHSAKYPLRYVWFLRRYSHTAASYSLTKPRAEQLCHG